MVGGQAVLRAFALTGDLVVGGLVVGGLVGTASEAAHAAQGMQPSASATPAGARCTARRHAALAAHARLSLQTAFQHGVSSKRYWHMVRTLVRQQALSNAWLKAQGLVNIKDLWSKAQGYAN